MSENKLFTQGFGDEFTEGIINQPPLENKDNEYPLFVPQIDTDGNDVPGVRCPPIRVPRGTYTGWNLRPNGSAENAMASITGSYFPFKETRNNGNTSGDPRPPIDARYSSQSAYVSEITQAANDLVEEGFLLEEDAERYISAATENPVF